MAAEATTAATTIAAAPNLVPRDFSAEPPAPFNPA
jgi:hypothetical protein